MAAYKTLKGQSIRQVAQDPTNPQLGEIWYNNTIGVLKGYKTISAAWASGSNMGTGRNMLAGTGTQTAALAFGGEDPSTTAKTEEYNGSSWSEQNDMPTAQQKLGGLGIQTAALAFGGSPDQDATFEYNGSSWTVGNNLGTGNYDIVGTGTQTAGVAFGGQSDPDATQEYDGTNWTAGGNLNTGRRNSGRAGVQTAALGFGGYTPSPSGHTNKTEAYNGTAWTELSATMNLSRREQMTDGATNTAAIAAGGTPPNNGVTEIYNGTSWVTTASMGTARYFGGGAGTTASFLAFGGGPDTDATEEFTDTFNAARTLTTS